MGVTGQTPTEIASSTTLGNSETSSARPTSGMGTTQDSTTTTTSQPPDLPFGECLPAADNCPEGFKCLPVWTGSSFSLTRCAPVIPDAAKIDQPCEFIDSTRFYFENDTCERGTVCILPNEQGVGRCVAFCDLELKCADPFSSCIDIGNDFTWCSHCDPLAQDCVIPQSCVPSPGSPGFYCNTTNGLGTGTPCKIYLDCITGSFCAEAGQVSQCNKDEKCCAAYCDLSAPVCPDPGDTCIPWFTPGTVPPPYNKVGRCGAV